MFDENFNSQNQTEENKEPDREQADGVNEGAETNSSQGSNGDSDWQPYYNFNNGYNPPPSKNTPTQKGGNGGTVAVIVVCICVFLCLLGLAAVGILGLGGGGLPSLMGGDSSLAVSQTSSADASGDVSSDRDHTFTGSDLNVSVGDVESSTLTQPGVLVAQKVCPSVVGVLNYKKSGESLVLAGTGSGIILSEDGFIVTNHHVVEDADSVAVTLYSENGMNASDSFIATVVGSDSTTDIALLKIEKTGLTPAEFADSNKVLVGETVYAVGNPGGLQFSASITQGLVSGLNRNLGSSGYIQTDVAINPGNSGGALVNVYGQVIGIVSEKIVSVSDISAEGLGFAIPSSVAVEIIDELINHGYVTGRVSLKVTVNVYTDAYAQMLGLPEGCRVYIAEVAEGSNAANAGVKAGLYITHVDGKAISDLDGLKACRDAHKAGEKITMTLYDAKTKKSQDISFLLEEDRG